MEVLLDVKNSDKDYEIAKYINNDRMFEEQHKRLKKLSRENKTIKKQLDEIICRNISSLEEIKLINYENENLQDIIEKQLLAKATKNLFSDFMKSLALEIKTKEMRNAIDEITVLRELKLVAENIVERFKNEIKDLKTDILLMKKIIIEENYKNENSAYMKYHDCKYNFAIEPVIDFSVSDKILITDFVVYPIMCSNLVVEKDELV